MIRSPPLARRFASWLRSSVGSTRSVECRLQVIMPQRRDFAPSQKRLHRRSSSFIPRRWSKETRRSGFFEMKSLSDRRGKENGGLIYSPPAATAAGRAAIARAARCRSRPVSPKHATVVLGHIGVPRSLHRPKRLSARERRFRQPWCVLGREGATKSSLPRLPLRKGLSVPCGQRFGCG